ncbi:endolysin [Bacillus phage BeachBum]|uniref:Endolysin n=1 Tax=Bacillus phage BeachBum TaxID=1983461 RepID=A0A1X9SGL2_9CAUD|nr:endolysin [Bacillus phage BeachBum]ARQ95206.1 endolysin [Bacillus phage BeachBum]
MKARHMSVSQTGVELVKHFEGCYLKAYQDVVGVWTIGYGNTQKENAYRGNVITQAKADQLLMQDLNSHMRVPKEDITVDLNQNQYDALCSFAFNLGAYIFRNNRNLLDAINSGNWNEASRIMNLFNRAGGKVYAGLVRRRKAETELMLKPMDNVSHETNGYDSSWFTPQQGTFKLDRAINLRTSPVNGDIIATLQAGDEVNYDAYGYEADGYVWIRQPRSNGYGYIATGDTSGGKRTSYWGEFQ